MKVLKALFVAVLAFAPPTLLFADEVKITTYYPAPYGSYNRLVVEGDKKDDGTMATGDLIVGAPGDNATIYLNGVPLGAGNAITTPQGPNRIAQFGNVTVDAIGKSNTDYVVSGPDTVIDPGDFIFFPKPFKAGTKPIVVFVSGNTGTGQGGDTSPPMPFVSWPIYVDHEKFNCRNWYWNGGALAPIGGAGLDWIAFGEAS